MLTKEYLLSKGFQEIKCKKYIWKEEETAMIKSYFVIFPLRDLWEFSWRNSSTFIKSEKHLEKLYEALMDEKL